MARFLEDGNIIGRVGALALLAAAGFSLAKICCLRSTCSFPVGSEPPSSPQGELRDAPKADAEELLLPCCARKTASVPGQKETP